MKLIWGGVFKILRKYKSTGQVQLLQKNTQKRKTIINNINKFVKGAIRTKVHGSYFSNEILTVDEILTAVNEATELPNFKRPTTYKCSKNIDFKFNQKKKQWSPRKK
jgi:hypothetical protein